jgi:outer membrane protein OmpA-like peptidoglycan-associated protein
MRRAALLAALTIASAAGAAEIPLPPGAVLAAEESVPFAMAEFPEGPWMEGPPPTIAAEGPVLRRAWRVPAGSGTPDQLLIPIRDALQAGGSRVLFTCAERACGGYDFRFALDLLPPPAMFVDLGNYRYLLAEAAGGALVSVVTSTGLGAGYIHVTTVEPGPVPDPAGPPATGPDPAPEAPTAGLAQRLLQQGHVVLDGLEFPSGSASLPGDRYDSLSALAAFLADNPAAVVLLVGHTDAVGALDANTVLSRARAGAVRTRLIGSYGADPDRIRAEGVGYLAPVASNLTPEGQAANRRVEAVLLSAP